MNEIIKKIKDHNTKHNFSFNEKYHIYTILNGTRLESVTTKLKKFFPFDAKKISKKVAEIRGISQEEVLLEWKKTADTGTKIHLLAEKFCKGETLTKEELERIKHAVMFFKHNPHLEILGTEVSVFSKEHKIAGTVDLIVKNKQNDKIYLLDYKTCKKEIKKEEHFENALGVLSDFANNKFYNYSMQVSIYSHILKNEYDIPVYDSMLLHLRNDLTYKIVNTEDMGMFVLDVLKTNGPQQTLF
jgi:ATP-dependent exoDNAse (exonuclease V) beta subunit